MKLLILFVTLVAVQANPSNYKRLNPKAYHALRVRRQATDPVSGAITRAVNNFLPNLQAIIAAMKANAKADLQASIAQLTSRIASIETNASLSETQKTCIAAVKAKITIQVQIDAALDSCLDPKLAELTTNFVSYTKNLTEVFRDIDFIVACIIRGTISGCLFSILGRITALSKFGETAKVQIETMIGLIQITLSGTLICMQTISRDTCKTLINLSMDVADCLNKP